MSWWEVLLFIVGLVVAVFTTVATVANIRNIHFVPRKRSTLRADLEIFKLLEPTDDNYQIVKTHIDSSIRSIYLSQERHTLRELFTDINWSMLILGIVMTVGLGWYTAHLVDKGSLWAILTGYFAFSGLLTGLFAFVKKSTYSGNLAPVAKIAERRKLKSQVAPETKD